MDNSLKDKVLEAVDIVEVVGERVSLTRKGKDFVGLCPFHPDHKPSFSVSPTKRIFKCWSCGAGGDVIRFVEKFERIDFRAALTALAKRAGIELRDSPADRQAGAARETLLATVAWAREHFRNNMASTTGGRAATEYALRRGLTSATIDRFGLGFALDAWDDIVSAARRRGLSTNMLADAGLSATNQAGKTYDRFRNRLIFPISDALGRPIAFGGRALGDDPAKYLNSPETVLFSKSRVLYGLDRARHAIEKNRSAIVVEGYMDAVMVSQFGFENVVATLGTALTEAHAKLLRPLADTYYLCFDSDDAGVRAADRAVELALLTQAQVRVVPLGAHKDPADCLTANGAEGFAACLKDAIDALEFKWSKALRAFGGGDQRSRRAATEEFIKFVANISVSGGVDPIQQDVLVGRLGELLHVPPEEIFDLLTRAKRVRREQVRTDHTDVDGASTYEISLRGLTPVLVMTMESVFGLLLDGPQCWPWVDETVAHGAKRSQTWERLYRLLLEVHEELGEYSLADVVSRCDDGAVCELVSRARARTEGMDPGAEMHRAVQRIAAELEASHASDLRAELHQSAGDDERVFSLLHRQLRGKDSVLPPERQHSVLPGVP